MRKEELIQKRGKELENIRKAPNSSINNLNFTVSGSQDLQERNGLQGTKWYLFNVLRAGAVL